jgi:hypothetical protein
MDLSNQSLILDATKKIRRLYYSGIEKQKLKYFGNTFEKDFTETIGDVKKIANDSFEYTGYYNNIESHIIKIANSHIKIIKEANEKKIEQILKYFRKESYIFKFIVS